MLLVVLNNGCFIVAFVAQDCYSLHLLFVRVELCNKIEDFACKRQNFINNLPEQTINEEPNRNLIVYNQKLNSASTCGPLPTSGSHVDHILSSHSLATVLFMTQPVQVVTCLLHCKRRLCHFRN